MLACSLLAILFAASLPATVVCLASREAWQLEDDVLVRHTKHTFWAAVDLVCTGVCQFKILHPVCRHQLVLKTQSHLLRALDQRNSHTAAVSLTQPDSNIPKRISTCTWCLLNSLPDKDRVSYQWERDTLGHCRLHIWTLSRAVLSPVERLSHSMPHLPLMDSRCPTGLWTVSAWDVPNVHQLPGRQLRARLQRQAQTYKKNHS